MTKKDKLEIAKKLFATKEEELSMANNFVNEAPGKFVGAHLEKEIARWQEDANQSVVFCEALEIYIDGLKQSHCTKCGDEVLGEEDSICANCV